jgi:hypothetical protein
MSIKLRFEHPSIQMQAVLKDDALVALLTFITEHKSDEVVLPTAPPVAPSPSGAFEAPPSNLSPANPSGDRSVAVKSLFSQHSSAEMLNLIGWKTNPEKILILAAYHESKSPNDSDWRKTDVEQRFSEAREQAPGNFTRDISNAVKDNLIAPVTYRTYKVSRTGWNRLAEATANLGGL